MSEIIIALDKSSGAKSFRNDSAAKEYSSSLIHHQEFSQIETFVNKAIKRAKAAPDSSEKDANELFEHSTISVSGSRGSGKTSFLLSVRDHFRETTKNIVVPGVIDPTLIEDKGHIFLNILSLLSELMTNNLNQKECNGDSNLLLIRKDWEEKLYRLAEGIPSMNGVESTMQGWHDAKFIMKTGLSQVKSAHELRMRFGQLIEAVLKELKKDALLLIFDDIDVDSSKGWQLLETLRKYCTSPRLITIISGDEKLYLNLVRQQKWSGFGKEILKYETAPAQTGLLKETYFNDIVTDLSGQYLQKILPTKYRIRLNTLLEKLHNQNYGPVKIKRENIEELIEIREWYKELMARIINTKNPTQAEVFITFMLDQPLRTQLQFMVAADIYSQDSQEQSSDQRNNEASKNLTETIVSLFHQDLQEQNLDIEAFGGSPKFQNILALQWLMEKGSLRDGYQLQPTTTKRSVNASLFTLTAMMAGSIKSNSFLIFDYFTRIAYPRNLLDTIGESNVSEANQKSRLQRLCETSSLFSDTVSRDSVNQMHGFIYSFLSLSPQSGPGISNDFIRLRGLEQTQKRKLENRIDGVLNREDVSRVKQVLGYIPAFQLSFSDSYKISSEICYSVHSLLSTVGELVKRNNILYTDEQEKQAEIERSLISLSQLREYPISFTNGQGSRSQQQNSNITEFLEFAAGKDPDQEVSRLAEAINSWCQSSRDLAVAPHLLGKTFTRFYFSLKGIAEGSSKRSRLGQILHLQIIAFFNAVLIEEALENGHPGFQKMNIGGLRTSHFNFVTNLKAIIAVEGNKVPDDTQSTALPLSRWLMQCPLLLAYLNFDENLHGALTTFNRIGDDMQWLMELETCSTLNQIDIKFQDEETDKKDNDGILTIQKPTINDKRISELKNFGFTKAQVADYRNNDIILAKVEGKESFGKGKTASNAIDAVRGYLKKHPGAW